jgi:glycosyltransferase involved in cell wall biosynthesis
MRVQIVQPVVPEYRVPFFELLASKSDYEIEIWASINSFDGIRSVRSGFVKLEGWHKFWGGCYWQCGTKLSPRLGPGDVLVICGNPRILNNIPLIRQARKRKIGVVWWGHGWTAGSNRFREMIRRWFMRFADSILLYTEKEVGRYKKEGFRTNRMYGANNTIDERPIFKVREHLNSAQIEKFRNIEGINDRILILFCGRLTQKARLALAIDAIEILNKEGDKYLLAVIGDGEELDDLCDQVSVKGLDKDVRWLGKIYDIEVKAQWFLASSCFVYPGAAGLSLIEAFCFGLPVVTHNNPVNQMPEISALNHGVNGLMFEEGDAHSLAGSIREITQNTKLRKRMSRAATQTIENEYSIEQMAERFLHAVDDASRNVRRMSRAKH